MDENGRLSTTAINHNLHIEARRKNGAGRKSCKAAADSRHENTERQSGNVEHKTDARSKPDTMARFSLRTGLICFPSAYASRRIAQTAIADSILI